MGGADRCAAYGCGNDRRYPDRYRVMPNAKYGIKFHKCSNPKHYSTWTGLLRIQGYKVTDRTRVCSNHFQYGQPFQTSPHPSLYLTGYDVKYRPARREIVRQDPPPKRPRILPAPKFIDIAIQVDTSELISLQATNHNYSKSCKCGEFTCLICTSRKFEDMESQISQTKKSLDAANQKIKELEDKLQCEARFSISDISHADELVKLYTGIPSYSLFQWLVEEVRPHAENMEYYRGKTSMECDKFYQIHNTAKPGPKRTLLIEDELLLTLCKLRLNLLEEDIAFRFRISQSLVSKILSTWIPFLAKELSSFIYWPSQQEIFKYYPNCFKKYNGCVRSIIDCTEIPIDRPSLAATNNEVYSQYKSRPTIKCLIGITPGGTISYVSKPVGGSKSDKQIVKMTDIIDKFEKGDLCMADRGFNIQELLLNKQVHLIIPPFKRTTDATSQFTEEEDVATKTIANARIHVERAIGRVKEFQIMQGPIHLTMIDLMEAALIVCAALVNLKPPLVPLTS